MAPAKPKPKPKAKAPAKPKPPATTRTVTVPNVASDPDYLRQVANYNQNYNTIQQGLIQQRTQYGQQYDQNMNQLGWDPITKSWKSQDRTSQYAQAMTDNLDDYAARGMGVSGAYSQAQLDLGRQFTQRQQQADTARQQQSESVHQQGIVAGNARRQGIMDAQAIAAQKIASKYGVGTGVVPFTPKTPKKTATVKLPVTGQ